MSIDLEIKIMEQRESLPSPDGGMYTVFLKYPSLVPIQTASVKTAREQKNQAAKSKHKKTNKKKENKKQTLWTLSDFKLSSELTPSAPLSKPSKPSAPDTASGTEAFVLQALPENSTYRRGAEKVFRHIAKIIKEYFKSRKKDGKADGTLCSLEIQITEISPQAVSFLLKVQEKQRRTVSFSVYSLTFSLPSGFIAFSERFTSKESRAEAALALAERGFPVTARELREQFYLTESKAVFFQNRFSAEHSRREADFFFQTAVPRKEAETKRKKPRKNKAKAEKEAPFIPGCTPPEIN